MRGVKTLVLFLSIFLVAGLVSSAVVSHSFEEIVKPDCPPDASYGILIKSQGGSWVCADPSNYLGGGSGGESLWSSSNTNIFYNTGKVKIASDEGFNSLLTVGGFNTKATIGIRGFGTSSGVKGTNVESGAYGVLGGSSSTYTECCGVTGTSATGKKYGTLGSEYGAYGKDSSNGYYGYLGSQTNGVYGGKEDGNFGYLGSSYNGAYGKHTSGNYGILGNSNAGVYGYTNTNFKSAVRGEYGANGPYGKLGTQTSGVYGSQEDGSYAGNFNGDVKITDKLTVKNIETGTSWSKFNGQVNFYKLASFYDGSLKLPRELATGDCDEDKRGYLAYRYDSDDLVICTKDPEESWNYKWIVIV